MQILSKVLGSNTQGCPFLSKEPAQYPGLPPADVQKEYAEALTKVDWAEVKKDLKDLFRDSKDWWPADYGHYGGFFIRLSWHTTGTYRMRYVRTPAWINRTSCFESWQSNNGVCVFQTLVPPCESTLTCCLFCILQ
jgi:catalase (peroxidase I)